MMISCVLVCLLAVAFSGKLARAHFEGTRGDLVDVSERRGRIVYLNTGSVRIECFLGLFCRTDVLENYSD